jgi:polar amino acid transport system substrate-binding protein
VRKTMTLTLGLFAILATACTSGGASPSTAAPTTAPTASSAAATTAPSTAPSASADGCAAATLPVLNAGKLTIGTDNPAYPPYFAENADGHKTAPWELGDPTNGQGFESAFAYALAQKMGFTKDQVQWVYVPFDNSFKPGPKTFDLDINQVSDTPERRAAVDMSDGYYFLNQAVVSLAANPVAKVTSIADLAKYRFGAQTGTTSLKTITDVIKPTAEPNLYDTNDAAIAALKAKQIDGIVVDLPTAFYMASAQLDNGTVVGQFAPPEGGTGEHVSAVLAKDSPITPCVNAAIQAMTADGSLAAITKEWLSDKVSAPVFTP